MDIQRINPAPKWSDATVFNGIGHFVEVAEAPENASLESQVAQIFEQAEASLATFNSDKTRLLSVTIYLTDFAYLETFNQLWQDWLPEGSAPSRACVKAELADPDYLLEITFVAAAK